MKTEFIIVGANLTGLCTALALSNLNQKSIIIERKKLSVPLAKDGRAIALSYQSKQILEKSGMWKSLSPYAGTIEQIRVTDQYSPFFLHFNKESTLGYLIESDDIQQALYKQALQDPNITIFDNSEYKLLENNDNKTIIQLNGDILESKLIIAADGKFSSLRKLCKINHFFHDYNQTAIVCKVQHKKPHNSIAQEIFLKNGPFAILPLKDQYQSGIVWTETPEIATSLIATEKNKFNYFITQKFTDYLGKVEVINNVISYPLQLMMAKEYYRNRIMLIGDSAHSVHPISGQGFNLALHDISAMSDLYLKYKNIGLDFGCHQSLKEYENIRMKDNIRMAIVTDSLNKLFSNNSPLISFARKLGLSGVNQLPFLSNYFMESAGSKKD